jgi:hypothetical protein
MITNEIVAHNFAIFNDLKPGEKLCVEPATYKVSIDARYGQYFRRRADWLMGAESNYQVSLEAIQLTYQKYLSHVSAVDKVFNLAQRGLFCIQMHLCPQYETYPEFEQSILEIIKTMNSHRQTPVSKCETPDLIPAVSQCETPESVPPSEISMAPLAPLNPNSDSNVNPVPNPNPNPNLINTFWWWLRRCLCCFREK